MIQQVVMTMNEKRALHFCLYTNEVGVLWYCTTAFDSTKLGRTVLYAVTILVYIVRYGTA
jgi:hypothetical protein